ncbi:hypothetical protein AgCh_016995 [Apium graveolens]
MITPVSGRLRPMPFLDLLGPLDLGSRGRLAWVDCLHVSRGRPPPECPNGLLTRVVLVWIDLLADNEEKVFPKELEEGTKARGYTVTWAPREEKKAVGDLMGVRKEEFAKSSKEMATLSRKAVNGGGSSHYNLNKLIKDIKMMNVAANHA